jgi:hypothetical protein
MPESFFQDVAKRYREFGEDWDPPDWHFGQGMAIRNMLRSDYGVVPKPHNPPIKDEQLPGLPEIYGVDYEGNWDDYYKQVIEAAAGLRPLVYLDPPIVKWPQEESYPLGLRVLEVIFAIIGFPYMCLLKGITWLQEHLPAP